ncbi:MAG: DNA replication/repair protein RecF [Clostridia bacterium]|nr:DNA replication/repair protein RecF [Clostridia bacterium]
MKKIKLENFRNYEGLELEFSPEINYIYGNNGQGKTNIVEAVYMFASLKSHRVNHDFEMIKDGCEFARLEMDFENKDRDFNASIVLSKNQNRKIRVNDIKTARNSDLIGKFNAVLFSPEDFSVIKEGPSERRRFTDIAISQIKPNYFNCLLKYKEIIKQKNLILKDTSGFSAMLDIYNENLAEVAADIIYYRYKFYKFISENVGLLHKQVTLTKDKFEIIYEPCVPYTDRKNVKKEILKKLERIREKEMLERTSIFGPHREDVSFFINGKKIKEYASQGQQRTAILILKLAQAEYIKEKVGEYPVLLLDDILSELDADRRRYFLSEIRNKQVIITSTDKGSFGRRKDTKLIHIDNAKVSDI